VSRVLVTGGPGFVGRPLVRRLIAQGEEVHALRIDSRDGFEQAGVHWHDADILDPVVLAPVLAEVGAERLVHLAWYVSHGNFWSALENVEWVEASLRLLRGFAEAGGLRAVLVGSCAEYAWGGEQDLDERDSPLAPDTLYGVCKDGLRRVAEAFAAEASVELAWGRLFFLYGPREQPGRLVPAVIRSLLGGDHVATSTGTQVRDFMHVEDAAGALAAVLQSDLVGAVNIATGRGAPVAEVLDIIAELTGAGELIERGARPAGELEPARIVAKVERLVHEVGFEPEIPLRDGLAATIEWWRDRPATRPAGS
jgi:nucleoside-diphosphate-sugar epimerase